MLVIVAVMLHLFVSKLNDVRDIKLFDAVGFSSDEHIQKGCSSILGLHEGCFRVERDPDLFRVTVRPPPTPLCLADDMMLPTFRLLDKYAACVLEGDEALSIC